MVLSNMQAAQQWSEQRQTVKNSASPSFIISLPLWEVKYLSLCTAASPDFLVCCNHFSCSNVSSPHSCLFLVLWSSPLHSHSIFLIPHSIFQRCFLPSLCASATPRLQQKGIILHFSVLLLVMPLVNHPNCKEKYVPHHLWIWFTNLIEC